MFSNSEVIELEKCKSCWDSNEVKLLLVRALTTEVNPIILDCFQWYLLTGGVYSSLSWWLLMYGWEWMFSTTSLLSDLLQAGILEDEMVNFGIGSIWLCQWCSPPGLPEQEAHWVVQQFFLYPVGPWICQRRKYIGRQYYLIWKSALPRPRLDK